MTAKAMYPVVDLVVKIVATRIQDVKSVFLLLKSLNIKKRAKIC